MSPRDHVAPDVAGWEGFYRPRDVNTAWLEARGIGIDPAAIPALASRVVRVVMATGEAQVPRSRVEQLLTLHCASTDSRPWNEDLCGALHTAVCDAGVCRYQHFGSCSGLAMGAGWVVTAAHCLEPLDDARARRSRILWPGADGRPTRSSRMGEIRLGKSDFGHDWVALDDEDPVDVAAVRTDDGPGSVP